MAAVAVVVRAIPYRLGRPVMLRMARVRPGSVSHAVTPDRIVRAVEQASRRVPFGGNCLVRALTTRTMLARHGHVSRLIVGVAKSTAGDLESHAWLEQDGRVVIGGNVAPFMRLPDPEGKL